MTYKRFTNNPPRRISLQHETSLPTPWRKITAVSCLSRRRHLYRISLAHINPKSRRTSPFSRFFLSGPSAHSGYRLMCALALPPSGMSSPGEQPEPRTNDRYRAQAQQMVVERNYWLSLLLLSL